MLADVDITPPANSPSNFLAWGLGVALLVVVVLWRMREKDRDQTIQDLKLDKALLETKLEGSEARADALSERYAQEVKSNAKTMQRMAGALTSIAAAPPIKMPPMRPDEDYEDSTGVSAAIVAKKRAEIDRILEAFHPNDSDRPLPVPPRPRGKLPSRSG